MSGERKQYTVVLERGARNWAAYVPDLGVCVATGRTRAAVERRIREAIQFHLEGLRQEGLPIPEPGTWTQVVDVDVPLEGLAPSGRPAEAR